MTAELEYLAYAMERYRAAKGMSPAEVAALFRERGLSQVVVDNYYLYHIESAEHMIADLDHWLETGSHLDAAW
ncbi:MAG: DUF3791 domain-containing protein [Atopobiaceae bacterium]|nr:DUF3791 domain-containing protein [Atopobiaceae bacterium]